MIRLFWYFLKNMFKKNTDKQIMNEIAQSHEEFMRKIDQENMDILERISR